MPGINPSEVARFFTDQSNTILGIVNMFSGGALSRLSIFAMGVMPYISASIIIQMMSMVVPSLMELRKEGESGRRKITEYTRYATVVLAAFQSFAAAGALAKGGLTLVSGWQFLFTATITMTTGTMFLMWLGEQITERGIGNGISMIILAGIVAGLPGAVGSTAETVSNGEMPGPFAAAADRPGARHDGLRGVRRAGAAPDRGELREAPGRPPHVRRPEQPSAVQAQHVGRDPADLRLELAAVPGHAGELLRHEFQGPARQRPCRTWRRRSATASRCTW